MSVCRKRSMLNLPICDSVRPTVAERETEKTVKVAVRGEKFAGG